MSEVVEPAPAKVRATMLWINGRYHLRVTEISSGATHHYELDGLSVAVLAETAMQCAGREIRQLALGEKAVQSFMQSGAVSGPPVQRSPDPKT